ncbi:hypothetical protein SMRU11_34260 [Sinorhizobium meliloti RU11/001]|nr:hypothetical protein SMRU11_34260 [Sinorhizobium meliloti RU11/001]
MRQLQSSHGAPKGTLKTSPAFERRTSNAGHGRTRANQGSAVSVLQRRASYQTRKGRCSTLICCMFLSFNRIRLKETCSS